LAKLFIPISGMINKTVEFNGLESIKQRLCHFANTFGYCSLYDSNGTSPALGIGKYEFIGGIGVKLEIPALNILETLDEKGAWKFGCFEYQEMDQRQPLKVHFYEPVLVFFILKGTNQLQWVNNGIEPSVFEQLLMDFDRFQFGEDKLAPLSVGFQPQTSKQEYLQKVEQIKDDIVKGKYYEMNYCIEFSASLEEMDLLPYFLQLNRNTAAPFAAYIRNPAFTLLCSSPERFLLKDGLNLVSQPIKGTNQRLGGEDNLRQVYTLQHSEKERAENVMIVDLVRNDLARVCLDGSVKVNELCGVYSFRTVNHLISTVSGQLKDMSSFRDIMTSLFPMGSMTGEPKIEVMKHIDAYEHAPRGIYSGCLGYIDPRGDFDFNVVIRSLLFDSERSTISYKVGSAITYDSVAEDEYEECLLKGRRLFEVMTARKDQR
jgi:para-aminobenzoate synthetase component 1